MIRTGKKKLSKNRMISMLDKACRQRTVIDRDGDRCQRCGKVNGEWDMEIEQYVVIQWAHVQTREYHCTRWDDDNSLALCKRCHVWFDNHKVLSYDWFAKHFPERWERIQRILQSGVKVNVKSLVEELRA